MTSDIEPSSADELLDQLFHAMRKYERCLPLNASELYGVIIDLANDAIEKLPDAKADATVEGPTRSSTSYFGNQVLGPLEGAMYVDLPSVYLPPCFAQVRKTLETFAKSWLADAEYPDLDFFGDKFFNFEGTAQKNNLGTAKQMSRYYVDLLNRSGVL